MIGSVVHYTVTPSMADHADCEADSARIVAMHEGMGYRRGGAYNGHACQHGGKFWKYTGPNQATGHQWANLNLTAISGMLNQYEEASDAMKRAIAEMIDESENGRNEIYSHHQFYATACCGPLKEWVAAGAPPPDPSTPLKDDEMWLIYDTGTLLNWLATANGMTQVPDAQVVAMVAAGIKRYDLDTATVTWLGKNLVAPAGGGPGVCRFGPQKIALTGATS